MKAFLAIDLNGQDVDELVEEAARWCRRVGGQLDLGYAGGTQVAPTWVRSVEARELLAADAVRARRDDTARLASLLESIPASHRGSARLLNDAPAEALIAASRDYDVLFVATHGRQGLSRLWLGSVAEQVVRGAECTVVVLRVGGGA